MSSSRRSARRLRFESLEVRRVMSADVVLSHHHQADSATDESVLAPPPTCDLNNPACVQALQPQDYQYLSATQVRLLSDDQMRNMQGWMIAASNWPTLTWKSTTPDSTGFSPAQIRLLNFENRNIPLGFLTVQQQELLTPDQVQDLNKIDFFILPPALVQHLTQAQVQSVTDVEFSNSWTFSSRQGLRSHQIPWLTMGNRKIFWLTPEQRDWLTPTQVGQVEIPELKYVPPDLVPHILESTLAQIHDRLVIGAWRDFSNNPPTNPAGIKPGAFDRLTTGQIQALDLSDTQFIFLSPAQRLLISDDQLDMLEFSEYRNDAAGIALTPEQISRISPAVFATFDHTTVLGQSIGNVLHAERGLRSLTPLQQTGLTRDQLLNVGTGTTGDFDQDGAVDGVDLAARWISNFGLAAGATTTQGDASGDGAVDGADLLRWQQRLGAAPAAKIWDDYAYTETFQRAPIGSYTPLAETMLGADGLASTVHTIHDKEVMFALAPVGFQTHTAMFTGAWNDPAIWSNNQVPGPGAKVLIPAGREVTYNANSTDKIALMRVDGTLKFAHDANTLLVIDTLIVDTYGKLFIGMDEDHRIGDQFKAKIEFPVDTPIDHVWDPTLVSRGLLSRGQVRMFGKEVTSFLPFAPGMQPSAGATQLVLSQAPNNWAVGDKLVIAGTKIDQADLPQFGHLAYGVEERIIRGISGNVVTVDPLQWDHKSPQGYDFPVHVANVERNIELRAQTNNPESISADRLPHIFFLHNWDVQIENIHVVGMGRTDKKERIVEPTERAPGDLSVNARGRYALHFHHTSVDPSFAARVVRGSSLEHGPGWGYVNHQSNVIMEDNFAYNFDGAGFVTEDGNEIGAIRRNLSIRNTGVPNAAVIDVRERADIHDFGQTGNGYWLQGPGVELSDNVANAAAGPAFAIFAASNKVLFEADNLDNQALAGGKQAIPVDSAPLKGFHRNTSYGVLGSWDLWYFNPTIPGSPSIIDGFTSWNQRTAGIALHYSNNVTLRDITVVGDKSYPLPGGSQPTRVGVFLNSGMENVTIDASPSMTSKIEDFDVGVVATYRFDTTIRDTTIKAVTGVHIPETLASATRTVNVESTVQFTVPDSQTELKGRTHRYYTMNGTYQNTSNSGAIDYNHISLEAVLAPVDLKVQLPGTGQVQLYFNEQDPAYVPFSTTRSQAETNVVNAVIPAAYRNKTNAQLQAMFGVSYGMALKPTNATSTSTILGGMYVPLPPAIAALNAPATAATSDASTRRAFRPVARHAAQ